jgi:thioredoxin-related protein
VLLFFTTTGCSHCKQILDTAFLESALDYLDSGAFATVSLRDWRAAAAGPATQAEPLVEDALFARPPYQLDRRHYHAQRPLLVLFEKRGCSPCGNLHCDVLSEPSIRNTLAGFDVVRLDGNDRGHRLVAPDGRVWTPAAWHRELGFSRLPALAVFDQQGQPALQTDALVLRGRFGKLFD